MPNPVSAALRKEMIIRKPHRRNRIVAIKSLLSFVLIWGLWLLTAYLIAADCPGLFYRPVFSTWTLADAVLFSFITVLCQLIVMQIWSIFITFRQKRKGKNFS